MLIGEGPGKNEDKDGIPFVGVSGREQDHTYFGLAGIDRADVFIDNCVLCRYERAGADVRPPAALIDSCAKHHLEAAINTVKPEIIILAGATACSLAGLDLEFEHGRPQKGSLMGHPATIVPMYHPAAGLRETRFMIPLLQDWENFGKWLRGKWTPPSLTEYKTDYRLLEHEDDLERYQFGDEVAVDTESDEGVLYSIQCSPKAGLAFMVRAAQTRIVGRLSTILQSRLVDLHNSVYDLGELERAGIRLGRFRDTMQEIYHLGGSIPQGLKVAVYRIFGFRMTSYDDVVTPASKQKLDDWLAEAIAFSAGSMRYSTQHVKGKGCPACGKNHRLDKTEYKSHESEAVLRRVMRSMYNQEENGFTKYDPWKQPWYAKGELKRRLLGQDWLEYVEQSIGRMPRASIVHAPLERQVQYACGDADWTGQLASWLEVERNRIVQEEWRVS